MLAETRRSALVLPSNDSVNYLFFKKLLTQLTRRIGIFRIRKLCISLSCNTWSKAPATFRLNINATCLVSVFYIVCTCSTKSFNTVSVERPRLALIQYAGNRWFAFATSVNFLITTDSRAFPIVFSSAISLYAFKSVQSFFLGLRNTTVFARLNTFGWYLSFTQALNRQLSASNKSYFFVYSTLFVICDSPGVLSRRGRRITCVISSLVILVNISICYRYTVVARSLRSA